MSSRRRRQSDSETLAAARGQDYWQQLAEIYGCGGAICLIRFSTGLVLVAVFLRVGEPFVYQTFV